VFTEKRIDEPVVFTVFRQGRLIQLDPVVLKHIPYLCSIFPTVDHQQSYLFIGPALFVPCSYGLAYQSAAPSTLLKGSLRKSLLLWPDEWDKGITEIVLLVKIMAHDESFDLNSSTFDRVLEYNGTPVKSLSHLRDLWEATRAEVSNDDDTNNKEEATEQNKFAHIKLEFEPDLVFEVKGAINAESDVLRDLNIPYHQRAVIMPTNPKYRFSDCQPVSID
jgi:PDZ domain